MATTTIGELLLHMKVDGDKTVLNALQRVVKYTDNAKKSTKNYSNTVNASTGGMNNFNSMLSTMAKGFTLLQIIDGVVKALTYFIDVVKSGIATGFDYNARIEKLTASMKALTGSEERATRMTRELTMLAAETPFAIEHYAKAAKTLLGYGVAVDDVIPVSKMLGDISMGNATAFDRLSLAYGQVIAKGKLQAEEVRQMVNQGFNPLKFIAEETGISMKDLSDKMRAGEISAEMVTKAFERATEKGGRFHGSMNILAKTFSGQKEKIQEYGEIFWGNVVRPFQDFIASNIFPVIIEGFKKGTNAVDEFYTIMGKIIPEVVSFAKAFMSGDFNGIRKTLTNLIPKSLNLDIFEITKATLKYRDYLQGLWDKAVKVGNYLKTGFLKIVDRLSTNFKKDLLPIIKELIKKFNEENFDSFKQGLSNVYTMFKDIEPVLKDVIKTLVDFFTTGTGTNLQLMLDGFDTWDDKLGIILGGFVSLGYVAAGTMALIKGDFKTAGEMFGKTFENNLENTKKTFNVVKTDTISLKDTFKESLYNMADASNSVWGDIYVGIVDTKNKIKDKIISTWENIKQDVPNKINEMKTLMNNKFVEIHNTISNKITEIHNSITNTWNNIKTSVSNKLNEIAKSVKNVFTTIHNFIFEKVVSILNFITPPIMAIYRLFYNVFSLIGTVIYEVMYTIYTLITNVIGMIYRSWVSFLTDIYNVVHPIFIRIKNTISSVMTSVWNTITSKWNSIKTSVSSKLNSIYNDVKKTWNSITGTLKATMNIISSYVSGKWNELKNKIMGIVNPLITFFRGVFNNIKNVITERVNATTNNMVSKWNRAKSMISSALNALRTVFSSVFNAIRTTVTAVLNSAVNSAVSKIKSLYNSINSKLVSLKNSVSNIFNSIRKSIKDGTNINLYQAGKNMISTLVQGIWAKIGSVKAAAGSVATAIKNKLGFSSPTKEGDGKTADEWIPNLLNMFVEDFSKLKGKVGLAAGGIASAIKDNLAFTPNLAGTVPIASGINASGQRIGANGNITINVYTNNSMSGREIGRQLVSELNSKGILTHK